MTTDQLQVTGAPAIPGLAFRRFRGASDYPAMAAAIQASADADQIERANTAEDIERAYAHLSNCDPYQDMIFAEVDGQVIGYSRGFRWEETNGPRLYGFVGFLLPAWRRRGLARALIVRSLSVQKEQGMTESALGADSENTSGATRVYEDCGFRVVQRNTAYRKLL